MNRIEALRESAFKEGNYSHFLVFNEKNLIYLTRCTGSMALIVSEQGESTVFVSSLNYETVKSQAKGFNIELVKRGENLMQKIADNAHVTNAKFAVDSLGIGSWRTLAKAVGGEEKLELANTYLEKLRQIKDDEEIALIRKSCKLTSEGMRVASEAIKPGIAEVELAAEIEYAMRKKGAYGYAFETIVASGPISAFPHGSFPERIIREGDLVVVDLGASYKFYCSDMSRTFVAGEPTDKQKKLYETVKLAHDKAFEAIKPNVPAKEVDFAARKIIEDAGFGEFFVHNLGHGVGLEVHELPSLNPLSKDILQTSMLVTDEPGIYLSGYGGLRIEDTILVTQDGAEKLTQGPYSLECI